MSRSTLLSTVQMRTLKKILKNNIKYSVNLRSLAKEYGISYSYISLLRGHLKEDMQDAKLAQFRLSEYEAQTKKKAAAKKAAKKDVK